MHNNHHTLENVYDANNKHSSEPIRKPWLNQTDDLSFGFSSKDEHVLIDYTVLEYLIRNRMISSIEFKPVHCCCNWCCCKSTSRALADVRWCSVSQWLLVCFRVTLVLGQRSWSSGQCDQTSKLAVCVSTMLLLGVLACPLSPLRGNLHCLMSKNK